MSGNLDYSICVWRTNTLKLIHKICQHTNSINEVCFAPNGQEFASCSDDNSIRIWNASTGKQLILFEGHSDMVSDVKYSKDGNYLISVSNDRTVRKWNVKTQYVEWIIGNVPSPLNLRECEFNEVKGLNMGKFKLIKQRGGKISALKENMTLNFYAPFALSKLLIPGMKKKGFGQIINLSSGVGKRGLPGVSSYSSSKAEISTRTTKIIEAFDGYDYFLYYNSGSSKSYPKS